MTYPCPHCNGTATEMVGPVKSKTDIRTSPKGPLSDRTYKQRKTVARFLVRCEHPDCRRGFYVPRNVVDPETKSTLIAGMRVEARYQAAEAAGADEDVLERITDDAYAIDQRRKARNRYMAAGQL